MRQNMIDYIFDQRLNETYEQTNEDILNERPYSRMTAVKDKALSKAKGIFGSGQTEQGAMEVGAVANSLWKEFKRYVGKKYGKTPDVVTFEDVVKFFNANGLNTSLAGNNNKRSFQPKEVGELILKAARENADSYDMPEIGQPEPKQRKASPTQDNTVDVDVDEPENVQDEPVEPTVGNVDDTLNAISKLSKEERELLKKILQ